MLRFVLRIAANGLGLYLAKSYVPGFGLSGSWETIAIGAVVLALFITFLRPILRFVSAPLIWLTLGLFNLVIQGIILWLADKILTQVTIADYWALLWTSILLSIVNLF